MNDDDGRPAMTALAHLLATATVLAAVATPPASAAADSMISAEATVDAPISEVWDAWTTTAGLRSWLAPQADIELRVDGVMRVNADPNGSLGDAATIENKILSYEPRRMLSIRVVKAPEQFPFSKKTVGDMWTVLYFQELSAAKTTVRIVGLGFRPDDESQRMRAFFDKGNAFTLEQLQRRFRK